MVILWELFAISHADAAAKAILLPMLTFDPESPLNLSEDGVDSDLAMMDLESRLTSICCHSLIVHLCLYPSAAVCIC